MSTDPQDFITEIINNAITTANDQTDSASSAADTLIAQRAGIWLTPPTSQTGFSVTAVEPDIPTIADTTFVYEAELEKLIALLSNQLAGFFQTYYPLASDAFDEATSWLINTITNGGTGINADIEAQIWQRDRERIITDGRRASNQIQTGYAAKGWNLVPGAMLKKIDASLYNQAANSGVSSTTIAVEQFKTEIETIKFAITQAINSRMQAMQAAADYIRAIATTPDAAARVASLNTDVKAKMMSAASAWYEARLDRDKIILSSKLAEMNSRDDVFKLLKTNSTQSSEVDVRALASAADVFARTASAALSSLNSIVSTATNAFS